MNRPAHRAGLSYKPISPTTTVSPPLSDDLNIGFFANGFNSIVDGLWYLAWSTIAVDEAAVDSLLCQTTPNDPCPFPPLIQEWEFFSLRKHLLSAVFVRQGRFRSFTTNLVLSPPEIQFDGESNSMSGLATAVLQLEGVRRNGDRVALATLNAGLVASTTIPDFDATAGRWSPFELSLEVLKPMVEFAGDPPVEILVESLLGIGAAIVNEASDRLLEFVNDGIETALARSPAWLVPDVEGFPLPDKT